MTMRLSSFIVAQGGITLTILDTTAASSDALTASFTAPMCTLRRPGRPVPLDCGCPDFRSGGGCLLTPHRMRPAVSEAASAPEAMSCDPSESQPLTALAYGRSGFFTRQVNFNDLSDLFLL